MLIVIHKSAFDSGRRPWERTGQKCRSVRPKILMYKDAREMRSRAGEIRVVHRSAFDSGRRSWERTCSRKRYFRRYIFGVCTGPFANKRSVARFASTPCGQKLEIPVHRTLQDLCIATSAERGDYHRLGPSDHRLLPQLTQLIRLDNPHTILLFQRQAPHGAGELAGFDCAVFAGEQLGDRRGQLFDPAGFCTAAHQQ